MSCELSIHQIISTVSTQLSFLNKSFFASSSDINQSFASVAGEGPFDVPAVIVETTDFSYCNFSGLINESSIPSRSATDAIDGFSNSEQGSLLLDILQLPIDAQSFDICPRKDTASGNR